MLTPGVRFDRYEIESLLGEGGMGRVYLARDTRLGRKVALKVLHRTYADAEGSARLLREARAAAALDHPNAVAIFDVGEDGGVPYLAMEYIEGRSLRDSVGDTTVPLVQRLRWLADIARALSAAHARGLVHRDIKPANVMIKHDGAVKVLDFGIARHAQTLDSLGATAREVAAKADTLTGPGMVVGTPDYMAPEQMLAKPVDGRSDQFAWGVTAYELITGVRPWTDSSDFVRLIAEVVSPDPVPTLGGRAEVPVAVAEAIDRALSKDPADRHASMNEIVKVLDAATAVRRSMPPPKRRRLVLAAGLGALAATVVTVGVVSLAGRRAKVSSPAVTASVLASAQATPALATAPTSMVDVPLPAGRPDAVLAFRRARQDLHDGNLWRGAFGLRTASRLDPSLVAPLVSLLTWDIWQGLVESRTAFSSARQLRGSLSERDRALLDAMTPVYATDVGDIPAAVAKLSALAKERPGDAEVQAVLAYWQGKTGQVDESNAAIDRALAVDPSFASAHFLRVWIAREPGADEKALEACITVSPTAASCIRALARIRQQAGDCATMEALGTKLAAIEPEFEWSYVYALNAIVARGGSREETRPILDAIAKLARAQGAGDGKAEGGDTVWPALVAFHYGAFDEGMKLLARMPDDETHGSFSTLASNDTRSNLAMLAAEESGDVARAAAEAHAYATRRGLASQGDATVDAVAARLLLTAAHEPAAQVAALAKRWAEQDGHADGPAEAPLDDATLRAAVALSPEAARDAMAGVNVTTVDLTQNTGSALAGDLIVGRAFAKGGRVDAAIPLLEEASRACGLAHSEEAFTFSRAEAQVELADALAARGDTAGACTWLGKVVAQWGRATPRSVTAERAKARRRALGCGVKVR